jgi:hypothetical protein
LVEVALGALELLLIELIAAFLLVSVLGDLSLVSGL